MSKPTFGFHCWIHLQINQEVAVLQNKAGISLQNELRDIKKRNSGCALVGCRAIAGPRREFNGSSCGPVRSKKFTKKLKSPSILYMKSFINWPDLGKKIQRIFHSIWSGFNFLGKSFVSKSTFRLILKKSSQQGVFECFSSEPQNHLKFTNP